MMQVRSDRQSGRRPGKLTNFLCFVALSKYRLILVFAAVLLVCCISLSHAQVDEVYVNITDIEVKEVTNAVQITIKADGTFRFMRDREQWFTDEIFVLDTQGNMVPGKPAHRFTWWIPNARSKLASSYFRVEKYPLSHIEVELGPPESETWWFQRGSALRFTFETYTDVQLAWDEDATNQDALLDWWTGDDRRSMLIFFTSNRQLKPNLTPAPESIFEKTVQPEIAIHEQDGLFDITALNADLRDIADRLSFLAGYPVSIAAETQRRITLAMRTKTLEEVLNAIGRGYGLSIERDGIGYFICDGTLNSAASYLLGQNVTRRMKYLKSRDASMLLPNFLVPYMRVNEKQNSITVLGTKPLVEHVLTQLEAIDQPPVNIRVETTVVEATSTAEIERALGLRAAQSGSFVESDSGSGDIVYRQLDGTPQEIQARLLALSSQSRAKVLSQASVVVGNGQDAELFIGQGRSIVNEFFALTWMNGQRQRQTQARIEEVKIGTRLKASPLAGSGDDILLTLDPEVSTLAEIEPKSRLPVVSTRRAHSTVRIKDGDTVMLGGLKLTQENRDRRKVPLLGDIPLIGKLFRSQRLSQRDSEIAVFITARKIDEAIQMVEEMTSSEEHNEKAMPSME